MKKVFIIVLILLIQFIGHCQQKSEIKNIAIYLQDNAEILDFAGPMEVFVVAGFNVYTVAETKEPIKAMHTLTIVPDYSIEDAPIPDIITFVGGGNIDDSKNGKIKTWAKKMASGSELQFSVCTGAFFLAEAGLLDGMIATTYHSSIPLLKESYPKIDVRDDVRFVDNGRVITTAGISAGIDGAFHLVAKIKGTAYAQWVADAMEYDKWTHGEGLIIKKNLLQEVLNKGFDATIKNSKESNFYNGEILDLAMMLEKRGKLELAEKSIRYIISRIESPELTTYELLRNILKRQGRPVPPTSKDFMTELKLKGVDSARKLHKKTSKEFPDWVYIDKDLAITNAYLDHYNKGDLQTATEIVELLYEIFPKDPYVNFVMGLYKERNDNPQEAMKFYNQALVIDQYFYMAQEKINELTRK